MGRECNNWCSWVDSYATVMLPQYHIFVLMHIQRGVWKNCSNQEDNEAGIGLDTMK